MPVQSTITGFGNNKFGLTKFGDDSFTTFGSVSSSARNRISEIEREWYSKRVPNTNNRTPLNELQKRYWESQLGTAYARAGFHELEAYWLKKLISTLGRTPSSNYLSTLWSEVVSALGVTPSRYLKENKLKFFINRTL